MGDSIVLHKALLAGTCTCARQLTKNVLIGSTLLGRKR